MGALQAKAERQHIAKSNSHFKDLKSNGQEKGISVMTSAPATLVPFTDGIEAQSF